jgi:general secretion pathway protein F
VALFRYKALSAAGESLDGQMEAANADEVIVKLQDQGYLPVEARRADEGGGGIGLFARRARRELDAAQILQFTTQLATLLAAGQPLDRALSILLELPETGEARKVISRIRDVVRGGAPLSVALEQQHGLFSRLYVNLVRAGESGGGLDVSLRRLAEYLERSRELRERVVNALIYPAMLVVLVGLSLVFLLTAVIRSSRSCSPASTRELAWYTNCGAVAERDARGWWWLGLLLLAAGGLWLNGRMADPRSACGMDGRAAGDAPRGSLVARLDTARLARTLGTLVGNGVPPADGAEPGRQRCCPNRVLAAALEAGARK